jgi:hypothetical protein
MSEGTAVYEIEAGDVAQVLCRILGLFAQQDRPLASVVAHSHGDTVQAMVRLPAIDNHRASVLAEKLRALAMVDSVAFTFSPARAAASLPRRRLRCAENTQHVTAGHLADVGG